MSFRQIKSEFIETGLNFFLEFDEATEKEYFEKDYNLEMLNHRKELVLDFKKRFPNFTARNKYDPHHDLIYRDKEGVQQIEPYEGGCRQFIIDVNIQIDNYIKFIEDYIANELQKIRPKEFPSFGEWNSLSDPHYFISKKGVLGCISEFIEYADKKSYPDNEDIYRRLKNVFYQPNGKPYKQSSFKTAKDRANKIRKQKCFNKGLKKETCVEFLNYLLYSEQIRK